jgi:hypothetical protein
MQKRFLLLLLLALSISGNTRAGPIDTLVAATVARNFYLERLSADPQINNGNPEISIYETVNYKGIPVYHVFNITKGGFIIVSANDRTIPVLGYSFEGVYGKGEMPCNFKAWMEQYCKQITEAGGSTRSIPKEICREWERFSAPDFLPDKADEGNSVLPMLTSTWNQDNYYNSDCPPDDAGPGGHAYAGCVATAMGQLMYFYRFPQQGTGSYSYQHPVYGTISANFGATSYNWEGMPNSINTQNDPIAKLLFHLGASVDMDFGPDGSGMWNHKAAYSLRTYFNYCPATQYIFRDSTTLAWDSILITNLRDGKPLYYAGWEGVGSTNGHAFVCDGYQDSAYYHFNWGWSGSYNGYFYINQLNPGGSNFNFAQEVIKDIFPDTLNHIYPVNCQGMKTLTYNTGSIDDGSGVYPYAGNTDCSWLIAPLDYEHDSITSITLSFSRFDTESGADSVSIYNGETTDSPLIGHFSGHSIPPEIVSNGNKMLIVFRTNASVNESGWLAEWKCQYPLYCSGTESLTEPFGSFGDGSGNKHYNNNTICKWKIQPPGASSVTISFSSFDTEALNDNLKIYDPVTQQLLASCSGNQLPNSITAESGKMMLVFTTNSSVTGNGWEAIYTVGNVGEPKPLAVSNANIYPNPCFGISELIVNLQSPMPVQVEILDSKGVKLQEKNIRGNAGNNIIALNLHGYAEGIYFIHVSSKYESFFKRVILLKE